MYHTNNCLDFFTAQLVGEAGLYCLSRPHLGRCTEEDIILFTEDMFQCTIHTYDIGRRDGM